MKKITNSILGLAVFAFVGCGTTGTDPQGAIGSGLPNGGMVNVPDSQSQGQTIDGIWYVFRDRFNNQIDLNEVSHVWEFDKSGNIYEQNRKIATYSAVTNTKLKMTDISNPNIYETIDFLRVANKEGNCFYTNRVYSNNTQQEELWCKKPDNTNINDFTNQNSGDMRPQLLPEEGYSVDLKDYLYPYHTLVEGGKVTQVVNNYEITSNGNINNLGSETKIFTRSRELNSNNIVINEFINSLNDKTKEDVIYATSILSYDHQNGISERYPYSVKKNSKVTELTSNGVTLLCVVNDVIGGAIDLSSMIPSEILANLPQSTDQYIYYNVIHIHCGATDGTTIDSYNVNGWGEVLSIIKYADGSTRYEILDKKSIQF
jgi:hypothetical protein